MAEMTLPGDRSGAGSAPDRRPRTAAERRFAERAEELSRLDLRERFERMIDVNLWDDLESRSGVGSSLGATAVLRAELPGLLRSLGVGRLLDVPCGDFHWMSHVDLTDIDYVGGDIVERLTEENRRRYERPGRRFVTVDLTVGPLPEADAILCRDCLVHLSFDNVARGFDSMRRSGATYLLTTTFSRVEANADVIDGDWRPLNFELPPFGLPSPITEIVEGCEEEGGAYSDKTLAVWRIADIP